MRPRLWILCALSIICLAITLRMAYTSHAINQSEDPRLIKNPRTIGDRVKNAKTKGEKTATVGLPYIDYDGSESTMEEALASYSSVIAEPVAIKSYIQEDKHLATWYKFKITEKLSGRAIVRCSPCLSHDEPPAELLTQQEDEFLVNHPGGSIEVDGVIVSSPGDNTVLFSVGERYLLLIKLDYSSRIATLGAGPHGVFQG